MNNGRIANDEDALSASDGIPNLEDYVEIEPRDISDEDGTCIDSPHHLRSYESTRGVGLLPTEQIAEARLLVKPVQREEDWYFEVGGLSGIGDQARDHL
jgi:hypothetical protein